MKTSNNNQSEESKKTVIKDLPAPDGSLPDEQMKDVTGGRTIGGPIKARTPFSSPTTQTFTNGPVESEEDTD
jgi:hypothetical protein